MTQSLPFTSKARLSQGASFAPVLSELAPSVADCDSRASAVLSPEFPHPAIERHAAQSAAAAA